MAIVSKVYYEGNKLIFEKKGLTKCAVSECCCNFQEGEFPKPKL